MILRETMREYEAAVIKAVLKECKGHRAQAAKVLGISMRSLMYKLARQRAQDSLDKQAASK